MEFIKKIIEQRLEVVEKYFRDRPIKESQFWDGQINAYKDVLGVLEQYNPPKGEMSDG